ncbi:MAG: hypothetical protein K0Q89_118 [Thermomicrobiales bacterium]|nr:hypothetical protein [Thermomicrobiales bacterium]
MLLSEWLRDRLQGEWIPTSTTLDDVPLLSQAYALGDLHIGDRIYRRVTALDFDGFPVAATVTGKLTLPNGTISNMTVTAEATGIYRVAFPIFTLRGYHTWRITATGAVAAVEEGRVRVNP